MVKQIALIAEQFNIHGKTLQHFRTENKMVSWKTGAHKSNTAWKFLMLYDGGEKNMFLV